MVVWYYRLRRLIYLPLPCWPDELFSSLLFDKDADLILRVLGMGKVSSDKECSANSNGPPLVIDEMYQFQTIVEAITSAVFIFQGDNICYANPHTESLTGYSKDELLAMPFWGFVHPDFQDMIQQRGHARQNGAHVPDNYDFKIVCKNGDVRWVNWRANVIELGGKPAVMGVGDDITERKQMEKMLNENKNLYQSVVEQISDGIGIVQDSKDVYVNPAVAKMWGKSAEDIVGRHFLDIIHPDEHERLADIYKQRMAGSGPIAPYEIRCRNANGDTLWVEMTGTLIQFQGKPADLVSVRDISERKQAEQELRARAKKYRGMVMSLMEGFYRVTWDGKLQDYNIAFTKILGLDPNKDYTGIELPIFWQNPEDRKDYASEIKTHGFIKNYTVHAKKLNGEKIILQVNARLIKDKDAKQLLIEGSFLDITERKQVEAFVNQTAEILKMVATGKSASTIYDAIALLYETQHPGMRCSMLELKGNKLMHGGAPSLPEEYCNAVNGLQNGPNIGSCGTSTYTGKRVLVEDIATDPKWASLKKVALPHGLRSCWSEPIRSAREEILGAFGMYYNHPALPNEKELNDLKSAARLAGIVMEREQREGLVRQLSDAVGQAGWFYHDH